MVVLEHQQKVEIGNTLVGNDGHAGTWHILLVRTGVDFCVVMYCSLGVSRAYPRVD